MSKNDTPASTVDDAPIASKAALQQALEHRFRHTMRTGQVSPLLHLVLRYKQEVPPCTAPT